MPLYQLQQHLGRVSHCNPRVQPAPQHWWSYTAVTRRPQAALQAQPRNSSSDGNGIEPGESKAPKPKRKYKRRKDPAEVSARNRAAAYTLVEYEGEMIPAYEKSRRVRVSKLVKFEGREVTVAQRRGIELGRALPPGAKYSDSSGYNPAPSIGLPSGPWGRDVRIHAPRSSQEGGSDSLFCHRRDALQLAAHELGARPAADTPPGVVVVTSAGKEYFKTVLPPFQPNHQLEGLDPAKAREAIVTAIKARMVEIHEQLMRWPQVPSTSAQTE